MVGDAGYRHFLDVENKQLEILQEQVVELLGKQNALEVNYDIQNAI